MSDPRDVCLVATCHDPLGRFAAGIETVGPALAQLFAALAVNATAETHPATLDALRRVGLPTAVVEHGVSTVGIGTARRAALALGLESGCARLFHSDLDHVIRWLSTSRDEVEACLAVRGDDLVIVGRSPAAMVASPERLQRTEELVNHVFALATRSDERDPGPDRDLMIAMRLMTRDAARTIVEHGRETTIANDVTWPMTVAAHGGTVGYVEADGIRYLAGDDFGQDADRRDDDPREWAFRMDVAALHVRAIVDFDPS